MGAGGGTAADGVRLLIVGSPGGALAEAAAMARDGGGEVETADGVPAALALLRAGGHGLVMIDVALDVPAFLGVLRAERFAVPVLACGIDAPAAAAVAAIRAGARDYVPLPPDRALIAAAIAAAVPAPPAELVGRSEALARALDFARAVAPTRAAVLIAGEPGTGKAAAARLVHDASARRGRYLAVECAGVPAEVLVSELFGHEAGSFAGAAARRAGGLEKAAGGTLFLKDVDRLPPTVQAMLARALASGRALRLGGALPYAVDARLIASTSADLAALVAAGTFRADLAERLALVRVVLPPLRARAGDIALLVPVLAARIAAETGLAARPFGEAALALMAGYGWPGNVRELEQAVHRALILAGGAAVDAAAVVFEDGAALVAGDARAGDARAGDAWAGDGGSAGPAGDGPVGELVGRTVEEVERALILKTLERCRGNRTSASSVLGISVRTMRNKLKSFVEAGIPVAPAA